MRTLMLILGCLRVGLVLTDPCIDHNVLDQPWRSIDCGDSQCSSQRMCDDSLIQRWYRFGSSGGWKIPEDIIPIRHCSTYATGWLNGSHPTVGQGELTRTVCFNFEGYPCQWNRKIQVKNCGSYFVYELKPVPDCDAAYCTVTDLAPSDPCKKHKVLDQPWRSTSCRNTECSGELFCDTSTAYGWYRFKSSGGWNIPETVPPINRCSGYSTAWLNGSHPTMGEGEARRTICIHWGTRPCFWVHEIKIRNCLRYFVYQLKALHYCAAYCTDPETTTHSPETTSPPESVDRSSNPKTASAAPDPETTTHSPETTSTPESVDHSSNPKTASAAPDPETTTHSPETTSTPESVDHSSNPKTASAAPGSQCRTMNVKVVSVKGLTADKAKRIVLQKLQQISEEQCPDKPLDLDQVEIQCSPVDPPET